jgi:ABC-type Zn2+ transport system substrate-binding protein/surface adhesin
MCYVFTYAALSCFTFTANLSNAHDTPRYTFVVMWSLGAALELPDRAKLQAFMKGHAAKIDLPKMKNADDSIFDYHVNEEGEWEHWSSRVEKVKTHTHTHTHTHAHAHAHAHTHTRTHARTHAQAHTHHAWLPMAMK